MRGSNVNISSSKSKKIWSERKYNHLSIFWFQSSAIQGKGMSIQNDQKKSILNKLFKNGAKINQNQMANHQQAIQNNYTTVNSSFNEQLMN